MSSFADVEVKLFASAKERRKYDDLADLYSILVATEHLEKAFGRDAVGAAQYEAQCSRLISQFKLSEAALRADGMTFVVCALPGDGGGAHGAVARPACDEPAGTTPSGAAPAAQPLGGTA